MNQTTRKIMGILGLIILLLSMIFYTGKFRSRYTFAEDLFMTGLAPVQGFFSQLGFKTVTFFQGIVDYERVLEQNKQLETKLAARDNLNYQLLELQKENYRLRKMLGFKERTEYALLPAEVIARDPSHWFETITINKGYADGVKKDMAVVTAQGLVGNAMFVSRDSAQVLMLTDSRRAVGALVQRSREPGFIGIAEGYPEKSGYLKLMNLPPEANIQPGDTVITSGLGGVFPKGLVIGHILETGKDQYGLLQQATVAPAVNFNRLEEVFIILTPPAEKVDAEAGLEDDPAEESPQEDPTPGLDNRRGAGPASSPGRGLEGNGNAGPAGNRQESWGEAREESGREDPAGSRQENEENDFQGNYWDEGPPGNQEDNWDTGPAESWEEDPPGNGEGSWPEVPGGNGNAGPDGGQAETWDGNPDGSWDGIPSENWNGNHQGYGEENWAG